MCEMWLSLAVFAALCMSGYTGASDGELNITCRIRLDTGVVQGYIREAEHGAAYLSFRGIPYAAQPVGNLRFKNTQRAEPWSDILEARDEGPICPQHSLFYGNLMHPQGMDEACLHLNVHMPLSNVPERPAETETSTPYTKQDYKAPLLPVLVFIHGGGFGYGSGDADIHGPEYLVTKGVIVVTFNYRVGAFGFLSLDSAELPGNLGMRDIVEVLKWVQRNIKAFGGDPDNVTVGGQSAGSVATHLLTLSPMAKGLFHRAILMSGVAMRSFITTSPVNAKRLAQALIQKLNITSPEPTEIYNALLDIDVGSIVRATKELQDQEGILAFVPVVESKFEGIEPFLDQDPETMIKEGRVLDVPLIIGHTDKECYTFKSRFEEINFVKRLQAAPLITVPIELLYTSTQEQIVSHVDKIKNEYFGGRISDDSLNDFLKFCGDSYFIYPAMKLSQMLASRIRSPIYLYQFSYDGDYGAVKETVNSVFSGAGHIEDQAYVMKINSVNSSIVVGSADEWVKDWMTVMFTNYMKTSDPTPEFPGDQSLEWGAFEPSNQRYLNINDTIRVEKVYSERALSFFDNLYGDTPTSEDSRPTEGYDDESNTVEPSDTNSSVRVPTIDLLPPKQ